MGCPGDPGRHGAGVSPPLYLRSQLDATRGGYGRGGAEDGLTSSNTFIAVPTIPAMSATLAAQDHRVGALCQLAELLDVLLGHAQPRRFHAPRRTDGHRQDGLGFVDLLLAPRLGFLDRKTAASRLQPC